jgi:hypothetical protein
VSEDAVKEAAYDLFLPGHLQKLARGLAFQPKPFPHGISNTGPQWNADPFVNGHVDSEHDVNAPYDDAPAGPARQHGARFAVPATPPAMTADRSSQRVGRDRQPRTKVRLLASAGAVLLLVAAAVYFAPGVRQSDRATQPPREAAIASSDQAAASNEAEPAPDAGRDPNAANQPAAADREQDATSRAPAPAASLPEVMPEAMDMVDSEQASPSPPPDRTFAAVEPRRPPPRIELNPVALAQSQLNALGYSAGPVDGVVGPRTRAAIRRFQADAGLPVDGRMNDPLIAALRRQSTKSNFRRRGA